MQVSEADVAVRTGGADGRTDNGPFPLSDALRGLWGGGVRGDTGGGEPCWPAEGPLGFGASLGPGGRDVGAEAAREGRRHPQGCGLGRAAGAGGLPSAALLRPRWGSRKRGRGSLSSSLPASVV